MKPPNLNEYIEKGEDRNILVFSYSVNDGKVEGYKTHLFGWEEKWEVRKCSLYKFTHMPLLHNIINNFFVIIK